MEQEMAESEVKEEYQKAKVEGRQPLCPYCNALLEVEQYQYVFIYWRWNSKEKRYEKEESDGYADKPFCTACETKDWDFIDNEVIKF